MNNAKHPENTLTREKALLFSDYHQPYHFLSHEKEKPNTSIESVYGGSDAPSPRPGPSKSGDMTPGSKRRRLEPARKDRTPPTRDKPGPGGPVRSRPSARPRVTDISWEPTPGPSRDNLQKKDSPRDKNKDDPKNKSKPDKKKSEPIKQNLSEATSMEWDPYLGTKKKEEERKRLEKKAEADSKKKRNISPITEEPSEAKRTSVEPQIGSENNASPSDASYPLNSADTATQDPSGEPDKPYLSSDSESASPPQKRAQRAPQLTATDPSGSPRDGASGRTKGKSRDR